MQEKINDEVQYNQIRITIRGSDQLRNSGGSRVDYELVYGVESIEKISGFM